MSLQLHALIMVHFHWRRGQAKFAALSMGGEICRRIFNFMQMRTTGQSVRRVYDLEAYVVHRGECNKKKLKQDGRVLGVSYWEIFYVNKGVFTTFYMSTSTRFVVYMLQECCQGKQNILGLN